MLNEEYYQKQLDHVYEAVVAGIVKDAKEKGGHLDAALALLLERFDRMDKGTPMASAVADAVRKVRKEHDAAKREAVTRPFADGHFYEVPEPEQEYFKLLLALIHDGGGKLKVSQESILWVTKLSPEELRFTAIQSYMDPTDFDGKMTIRLKAIQPGVKEEG